MFAGATWGFVGALFRMRFIGSLQYRVAALAGLVTQVFFGAMYLMLYDAFYANGGVAPLPREQLTTYVWFGQAFLGLIVWASDPTIREQVRTGDVATELLRPADLYLFWFVRVAAERAAAVAMRAAPILGLAWAMGQLVPPAGWVGASAFVVSIVLALALSAAIANLVHVMLFWSVVQEGLSSVLFSMSVLFSGMSVPIPLLPEVLQRILPWLPFAGVFDTPFKLWLGVTHGADVPLALLRQLVWIVVLMVGSRALLARFMRKLSVAGG